MSTQMHFAVGEYSIWYQRGPISSGLCKPTKLSDDYALILPLSGVVGVALADNSFVAGAGSYLACDVPSLDHVTHSEFGFHIGISFSEATVLQLYEEWSTDDRPLEYAKFEAICGNDAKMSDIGRLLLGVLTDGRHKSASMPSSQLLTSALVMRLVEARVLAKRVQSHSKIPTSVAAAVSYMRQNIAVDLSIEQIANAVGVQPRALQLSFQKSFCQTPLAYLKDLRLEGVRAELRLGELTKTVSQVAQNWGFTHMGRFSSSYAKAFGEKPSDTVARSKIK